MKPLQGTTDLWCFPIMGEETWAGVDGFCLSFYPNPSFHLNRSTHHDPSTQQIQNCTSVKP